MMDQGPNGRPARQGVRRLSVAHFLIALVLWLLCYPFVEQLRYGVLIDASLMSLMLLSAVMAVGGRRRTLLAAAVLVTPALVATWLDHFRPDLIPIELTLGVSIVFVGFVIMHLLRFILRAPWVNAEVLCAAVATYLMMAILWAFAYTLVARLVPDSFNFTAKGDPNRSMARFEAVYFSLSTLTTVGYGDIAPVSNAARMLAMTEATTGVFYLALLVARLVGLYSGNRPAESTDGPSPPTALERVGR
jgi:hypothetical protein